MRCKDSNGSGFMAGGGSSFRKTRREMATPCRFLLFAALSSMFEFLFPVILDLFCIKTWLRLVVCNELNNLAVTGGLETSPVGRDVGHKLGI